MASASERATAMYAIKIFPAMRNLPIDKVCHQEGPKSPSSVGFLIGVAGPLFTFTWVNHAGNVLVGSTCTAQPMFSLHLFSSKGFDDILHLVSSFTCVLHLRYTSKC